MIRLFLIVLLGFSFCIGAHAESLSKQSLDQSDQFIFNPNDLAPDFFSLQTQFKWHWVPDSLEWTRVERKFLIPRARAFIEVPAGTEIRYHDHLFRTAKEGIEITVVLSQELGNELRVGGEKPTVIPIVFKKTREMTPALVLDSNCSQTPLDFQNLNLAHSWVYVSCKTIHPKQGIGFSMRVDVELRWETEGHVQSLSINGNPEVAQDGVTHLVSFTPGSGNVHLTKGQDTLDLNVPVPERFHPFWFSMGIGPYSNQNVVRAFPTFYAGYYFNDGMRIASFTALPLKANPEVDTGLYLVTEQFRGIDERIHFSLLLGAHLLSFHSGGQHYYRMSAPQGVELGFRDFLIRSQNLTFGGFFYPTIDSRFYTNTWIRYGNGKLFYEFNFINWQEPLSTGNFASKSAGVSIGFPIFRAL